MPVDLETVRKLINKLDPPDPDNPRPGDDGSNILDKCFLLGLVDEVINGKLLEKLAPAVQEQLNQARRLAFLNPLRLECVVTTDDINADEGVLHINLAPQVATDLGSVLKAADALTPGLVTGLLGIDVEMPNTPLTHNFELNNGEAIDLGALPLPFVGHASVTIVEDDDWPSDDDTLGPFTIKANPGPGTVSLTGSTGNYILHYEVIPLLGTNGMLRQAANCPPGQALTKTPEPRYSAVWRGTSAAKKLLVDLPRGNAIDEWKHLIGEGMRLVALEVFDIHKDDRWTMVLEPGDDAHGLLFGTRDAILKQHDEFIGKGLRMVDLLSYEDNGQRGWAAAWRAGEGPHGLLVDVRWDDFVKGWSELSKGAVRLCGVTCRPSGNGRLWSGFFRAGSDGHALWAGDWDGFVATWNDLSQKGLRLVDVVTYEDDGNRGWAGVWRSGTDDHLLLAGLAEDEFLKRHEKAVSDGLGLMSVAVSS